MTPPPNAGTGTPTVTVGASAPTVKSIPYRFRSVVVLGGGFVTGLVFSPVKAGILYARTDVGGAYRYDPGNRSWTPLTDFLNKAQSSYLGIESIAADPVDAERVYMAVGMYSQSWAGPGAFMRSNDRGNTWQTFPAAPLKMGGNEDGRANGERLAIDPHEPKILFFGSRRNGLWKSTDSAQTWHSVEGFPLKDDPKGLGIPFVIFDAASGKPGERTPILYAGASRTDLGLYRSTDGGESWQPVQKQPSGLMPSRAAFDRNGALYLSYGSGPGPYNVPNGALYRYDPKSETWSDVSPIKPNDADHFGYGAVAVDRERPGTLIVSTIDRWTKGGEIFRSVDGAKTWKPLMASAELDSGGAPYVYAHQAKISAPQWVGDIEIDPFDSNHAALVTGAGSWATEDLAAADGNHPTHWTFRNQDLEETVALGMVSPPAGAPLLTAMGDLCGFRHDSLDASPSRGSFEHPLCANSTAIDFAAKRSDYVVRVGSYPWDGSKKPRGALSTDGGTSWSEFANEPRGCGGSGSVAISTDGAVIVWASRDARPAYSTDSGTTWQDAAGLPDPAQIPDWSPHNLRLAADRVNPKKFYAFAAESGTAYASEDGGAHFRVTMRALPSLPGYDLASGSIQAVPGYEGDVWITSGKELYRSTDSGRSYVALSSVEEAYGVGFGHVPPAKKYPAIYLTGKVQGVTGFFRSDDEGRSFSRINDDAHQYGGSHLVVGDPRVYGRVYVAGNGRGVLYGEPVNQ